MLPELPRRCPCRKSFAKVDGLCLTCALKAAVSSGHDDLAYQIARDYGQAETETTVRAMLRERNERRQMAEASAAIRAGRVLPGSPVERAAVSGMRSATREMLAVVGAMKAA
jgi:hypothetical protein